MKFVVFLSLFLSLIFFDPFKAITISHKFVDMHAEYTPYIMERFKLAVATGEPVNPPIWWIAPGDKIAQEVDDQFLLGDKILVAPVIVKGEQ